MHKLIVFFFAGLFTLSCSAKPTAGLKTGAGQPEKYIDILQNKKVGLVVNHTSTVGEVHLIDFLRQNSVEVVKIFAPEHGFRGDASAGEEIKDGVDSRTGVPVVSLYGENRKPLPEHLSDVDILVFDIQDVGCRFYTYISTLHLVMEACAQNNRPLLVLDRPNPNGDYVAGPILKPQFKSFVGMHPIPVVHGCTVGELAQMINGEKWLENGIRCELTVITVAGYTHDTFYSVPLPPSPNLPNNLSVRLYPSLCFFEATTVSVGRGTDFPFQVLGGLKPELGSFSFTPRSIPTAAVHPLNEGKVCYGIDLRELEEIPAFTLKFFLDFYNKYENEKEFLKSDSWLNRLAGTDELIKQIRQGLPEAEIVKSWQPGLEKYKQLRKKYLLYPDFE